LGIGDDWSNFPDGTDYGQKNMNKNKREDSSNICDGLIKNLMIIPTAKKYAWFG
jgi:hypothetical protein